MALSLPLRLAEFSWRLNSPSPSDLHPASQRRLCWKSQGHDTSTSNTSFQGHDTGHHFPLVREYSQEEGAIRPRQTHPSCLSACHIGASVLRQKKMMVQPETCNQQLVTLLFCSGCGTAHSSSSGSGGDRMTIIYFDTRENVVIGETMEACCEEDPPHVYHISIISLPPGSRYRHGISTSARLLG